jgi:DNA gyrase subunit A
MQLRRLAALERQKIENEHEEVMSRIAYLEDLLANPKKILGLIKDDLQEITETYGDERRTLLAPNIKGDLNEEDLVKDEAVLISLTERGYIKRVAAATFRAQTRGGRGVKGHTTREADEVIITVPARSLYTVLFFSDKGKVYSEKAYQIPDAGRTAKGVPIVNVLALGRGETITAAVAVPSFEIAEFCTMMTRNGRIKRVDLSEFASVRPSGLIAMNLSQDDALGWVRLTKGDDDIIIVTEGGQALRFKESSVRTMGRPAAGVTGIKLSGSDVVTSMEVVEPGGDLLIVTTGGYGKRTPLKEYPVKGRATMGVQTIDKKAISIVGKIAAARVVQPEDHLTLMSSSGVVIRTKVRDITIGSRATRGVRVMNLDKNDSVGAVARLAEKVLQQAVEENDEEEQTVDTAEAPESPEIIEPSENGQS